MRRCNPSPSGILDASGVIRISVIIPFYSAGRFVGEAVASALTQPVVDELLSIEDGSPDGSLAVCGGLAAQDNRVRPLRWWWSEARLVLSLALRRLRLMRHPSFRRWLKSCLGPGRFVQLVRQTRIVRRPVCGTGKRT